MSGALVQLCLVVVDVDFREAAELCFQKLARVHVLGLFRAAGAIRDLLGRIAFEQQEAAGLQRVTDAGEHARALGRIHVLDEDDGDHVVGGFRPRVGEDIRQLRRHGDPTAGRQRTRFLLRLGGEVHRDDVEALLSEPNAVAAFAVRHGQRFAFGGQAVLLAGEEGVGLLAEHEVSGGETLLPALVFRRLVDRHAALPAHSLDIRAISANEPTLSMASARLTGCVRRASVSGR